MSDIREGFYVGDQWVDPFTMMTVCCSVPKDELHALCTGWISPTTSRRGCELICWCECHQSGRMTFDEAYAVSAERTRQVLHAI